MNNKYPEIIPTRVSGDTIYSQIINIPFGGKRIGFVLGLSFPKGELVNIYPIGIQRDKMLTFFSLTEVSVLLLGIEVALWFGQKEIKVISSLASEVGEIAPALYKEDIRVISPSTRKRCLTSFDLYIDKDPKPFPALVNFWLVSQSFNPKDAEDELPSREVSFWIKPISLFWGEIERNMVGVSLYSSSRGRKILSFASGKETKLAFFLLNVLYMIKNWKVPLRFLMNEEGYKTLNAFNINPKPKEEEDNVWNLWIHNSVREK